ncbi:MAG: 3-deoxy-manno-octulosonate cytidylyltransferase [Deltaproteobacteria bacterium]|nr:3-deoxy-manno-octulosonate cytidylyltransferase [Deltaproteobacteria bacterium]MBW1931036.1 3-deoxy-manno-octulosonate cytidylyltransferase [Deltaproteobacteria bacterium]MBW2026136.1 3-deoxy-manno-octulosonate cytidylyltransferase [Deltaproteobacteria bacterium]MBW2126874.1 3-deoxy-manno-octulosonate cytidylyltransferase [Deltaproteobacteria bacterium]
MKIVAIIPARYGSKRFPGKPLANIAGRPMIQHVYERARQSPKLNEVYVATDDERIRACVEAFGGAVVMTSADHASGTDRVYEAAIALGLRDEDIIVNIQGDQPLFPPTLVDLLVMPLEQDPHMVMSTLRFPIKDPQEASNPNHVKVVTDHKGFALYFSRSPIPYYREGGGIFHYYKHLGVYAYRMEFLGKFTALPQGPLERAEKLEQLRALEHGFAIKVVDSPFNSTEVDVEADIAHVEELLQSANVPW